MDGLDVFVAIFYGGVFILVAWLLLTRVVIPKIKTHKENPDLYEIISHWINKDWGEGFVAYLIELRGDKDWGKLIAFSGEEAYGDGDRYAFFEEGLYFKVDDYSTKEMFIPKDQLSVKFSKDSSSVGSNTYHYIDIEFTEDDKITKLRCKNKGELGEAVAKQVKKCYSCALEQELKQNIELSKRYSSFITKLKEFRERYKTISLPVENDDISLGEYVSLINKNIILGVDSKKNIGLLVSDEIIFEIDYDDFIDYSEAGKLDVTRELYGGEVVKEGNWEGKRIAAGLVLGGPIGAALIGKSKTKYSDYNYRITDVKDSRRLIIRTARVKAFYRLNSDFEYVNSTEEYINNKHADFTYNNRSNIFILPFEFYNTIENYFPEKIFKDKYEI